MIWKEEGGWTKRRQKARTPFNTMTLLGATHLDPQIPHIKEEVSYAIVVSVFVQDEKLDICSGCDVVSRCQPAVSLWCDQLSCSQLLTTWHQECRCGPLIDPINGFHIHGSIGELLVFHYIQA